LSASKGSWSRFASTLGVMDYTAETMLPNISFFSAVASKMS